MTETTTKALLGHIAVDKKRIRVSSKRQITIPMKFHALLGMSDEVDCHIRNGALIITPIRPEPTGEFAEEILADLVAQGLSGQQLLDKFAETNRKVRPAVQALIAEADKVATAPGNPGQFAEIFGVDK
jgi:bifunctional DNA-binding transcriptional regulator/antitoxin component of YhaV-PrlF toxin-antitoxin module